MITSRERVLHTLRMEPVDRAPRDLWVRSDAEAARADELAELRFRFPADIVRAVHAAAPRAATPPDEQTDAWGCTWRLGADGAPSTLVRPPLAEAAALAAFEPPFEQLKRIDAAAVSRQCAATSQFVLAWTETRVMQRLECLRGRDASLAELAVNTAPTRQLLARLHEFAAAEVERWAATEVDGVVLCDQWAQTDGFVLSARLWRQRFKPLYRKYCDILHARDKFVFFHTRGPLGEIFAELVDLGVDCIHAPLHGPDLERFAERFRHRVCFWGGLDLPGGLRTARPEEIRAAVDRVRRALDYGRGGLVAQCIWERETPFENAVALFERWLRPVLAHA